MSTTDDTSSYSDLSTIPNLDLSRIRHVQPNQIMPTIASISSISTETSFDSGLTIKSDTKRLNQIQLKKFEQRIGSEYEALQKSETSYSYYIEDATIAKRTATLLDQHPDGTFFVRRATETEQRSDVKYVLVFVSHKRIGQLPICSDKNLRTFWFLSGFGHGSEVSRVYTGIDTMIQHKQENIFFELEYPFQISLYKPIDRQCSPLPDEVRAKSCQNTILHELVVDGLIPYFNELIRITEDDVHSLRDKARFLVKKINGRNKQGKTPLILAIQRKKYRFIELLLDHGANVNITDIHGCSPLQYSCRLADPRSLKKLLDRGADPHYFNPKKTNETNSSNLSAFHYLAMATGASPRDIRRCAMSLETHGCPLISLTSDGDSPFDLAKKFDNRAYDCVKIFCTRRDFKNFIPIEVSSRNEAKNFLSDLACPNIFGKFRLRVKKYDNTDCFGNNGLFVFYHIKKPPKGMKEECGVCVHHNNQISVYPITQKYTTKISLDQTKSLVYKYSLISDTVRDDQYPIVLFRSYDELIYSYTKYQGILPILLKDYVKDDNSDGRTIMSASSILNPNRDGINISADEDDDDDDEAPSAINTDQIDSFNLSQINSIRLLVGNQRHLIWLANVQFNYQTNFPIIIKDYRPSDDLELFKQYRFNEFNSHSLLNQDYSFQYNSRARYEYRHESKLLLKFRNHPFIVRTFLCNQSTINRDLRIFMEYLPMGNLHTYLTKLKTQTTLEPFINVFHWIYQLAQAMAYLSTEKIVHRDLATRNILLKDEKYIKLSDFGLSVREGPLLHDYDCGISLRWTAPEHLSRRDTISSSADVWSFGIVLWEIFSFGASPYEKEEEKQQQQQQSLQRFLQKFLRESLRRLSRPTLCSESFFDLMCLCWNINETGRPKFIDIVNEFNGTGTNQDWNITFSREERQQWKKAKEHYLNILPQPSTMTNTVDDYVQVVDLDDEEKTTTDILTVSRL